MSGSTDPRRNLPGVDRLLASPSVRDLAGEWGRELLVSELREYLEQLRRTWSPGSEPPPAADDYEAWARALESRLRARTRPSLRPVINATGVVLHTNLGRAPLAEVAREAMDRAGEGYTNLEFDLEDGRRGSRYVHCSELLRELTGAEDALVVNNCAAALVLALNTVARGRGVVVSRGELIEIGGGFRIPEMLDRSGARLVEVGATNRTRLADYRSAMDEEGDLGAILKVHRSNFRIRGFTEEASLPELAELARERGVPLVFDLGSGLFLESARLNLPPEPTPADGIAQGADVVVASGDKLLGGPQAGIVVGGSEWVEGMRRNPLCRAFRVDKVALAGLEATLSLYRTPDLAVERIPALRMLALDSSVIESRARSMADRLEGQGIPTTVAPGASVVGGGTFPDVELPTTVIRIQPPAGSGADAAAAALRAGTPPVVCRIDGDELVLDLRTVDPGEEDVLLRRLDEVWNGR